MTKHFQYFILNVNLVDAFVKVLLLFRRKNIGSIIVETNFEMSDLDNPATSSNLLSSDNFLSPHLLLFWLVTLIFCWKVFPAIFTSTSSNSSPSDTDQSRPSSLSMTRPVHSLKECMTPSLPPPPSHNPVINPKNSVTSSKKLIPQLQLEVCAQGKEIGKHPSYVPLVLNLLHHYDLDINKSILTHKADKAGAQGCGGGVEVVQHLLQAGCQVNQTNLAEFTALHQAYRLSCPELVTLLLDWGAKQQAGLRDRNMSSITRNISVVTRSTTSRAEGLNRSLMINRISQGRRNEYIYYQLAWAQLEAQPSSTKTYPRLLLHSLWG